MDNKTTALEDGVPRRELFGVWRNVAEISRRAACVCDYIVNKYNVEDSDRHIRAEVQRKSAVFSKNLKERWLNCHYILEQFLRKNDGWLNGKVIFEIPTVTHIKAGSSIGRPRKLFHECSEKSRKRKLQPLLQRNTVDEIILAAQLSLRSEGRRDAAEIVKQVSSFSPKRATKIKKAYQSPPNKEPIKMTSDEALAFYVDKKLTKDQYISMRKISKDYNADIYSNYHMLVEAKKRCYPNQIKVTELSAEILLQSLLDHTIQSLVSVQYEVLKQAHVGIDTLPTLNVVFKWGCDGASGQSQYKQLFSAESQQEVDDSYIFIVSLVPLQMTTCSAVGTSTSRNNKIILWQNPLPASTKYCRPIKLLLKKETSELTRKEIDNIKSQISKLTPTVVQVEGREILIEQDLVLTMIDGKICSVLSNQATQNCHVCGATPTQMNNLSLIRKKIPNETALTLGLSSLHAWIKCFECVLHISYRLEIKSWQIRKENKSNVDDRKKSIQDRFRNEMGLLVDIPKPGFGTTNDGNTAQRFFDNPALASNISGVDEELIRRFGVILKTVASGYSINIKEFEKYCSDTAKLYVQKYKWYYMPQSVHKLLIHGAQVIKETVLPLGMLSEEAQEARNKDYKNIGEYHTRKFSRADTITDVMHMLLISSDPIVSSLRVKRQKRSKSICPEVLKLIQDPGHNEDDNDE